MANISTSDNSAAKSVVEDEKLPPTLPKEEEEEIKRLEEDSGANRKTIEDEYAPTIEFECKTCHMRQMVHYFGVSPPFVLGVDFLEDTYVMRDPFQPPPPRWKYKPECFVALGTNCFKCEQPVCKDSDCSFFYTKTYCLKCAKAKLNTFPLEVQAKVKKFIYK